jgi:hypothetical protein
MHKSNKMKHMAKTKRSMGRIIIPTGMKPRPRGHEIDVAEVLVGYFGVNN